MNELQISTTTFSLKSRTEVNFFHTSLFSHISVFTRLCFHVSVFTRLYFHTGGFTHLYFHTVGLISQQKKQKKKKIFFSLVGPLGGPWP